MIKIKKHKEPGYHCIVLSSRLFSSNLSINLLLRAFRILISCRLHHFPHSLGFSIWNDFIFTWKGPLLLTGAPCWPGWFDYCCCSEPCCSLRAGPGSGEPGCPARTSWDWPRGPSSSPPPPPPASSSWPWPGRAGRWYSCWWQSRPDWGRYRSPEAGQLRGGSSGVSVLLNNIQTWAPPSKDIPVQYWLVTASVKPRISAIQQYAELIDV